MLDKKIKKMENKKINVLHLISTFTQGGAEIQILNVIKKKKENITVLIMKDQTDEYLKQALLKIGCKVFFLNLKNGYQHPKYLFQLLKVIKENDIDIIHSHEFGSMMWSILCKIAKPKLKLVHSIQDSVIINNWSKTTLFFNRFFLDMNIAVSEAILKDCFTLNLKAVKIYNAVDTKKFNLIHEDTNSFTIINIARITYYKKGLDIFIKALKECKNRGMKFVCYLVGRVLESDKDSLEYLKRLIEDYGLLEEISFMGNREDIPELLARSDLFILPSRYEGLPLALLEAMAAKLPVIASNITGSIEVIENMKNGLLFESENHSDLAVKILFLYNNREEIKRLAQSGYEYVQKFDISIISEKYWNIYKSLVN